MNLDDLEGIGPARLEALRAVGILSLRDLLFSLPARYEDHQTVFNCSEKKPGNILVSGVFRESLKNTYFNGISRIQGSICDDSGKLSVCWYNEPWITRQIRINEPIRLYGRLSVKNGRRILQNPKIVTDTGWTPVYKSLKNFPAKFFRKAVEEALNNLEDCCPETLPAAFRIENRLCELNFALREAHFPSSMQNLEIARRRLSFEKILLYLIYVSKIRQNRRPAPALRVSDLQTDYFWSLLPFRPTNSQRKVLIDIAEDLRNDYAMARLVQGDVGCGKTAVAFGAAFLTCFAGYQACMMAPTEILAAQHFENAKEVFRPYGISCRLLTGSTRVRERKQILQELADGSCQILFGTHALISKDVCYSRLGLVITDEQHRFGVNQRSALQDKGTNEEQISPHVLVMSATPIPRSLALILYGDLDISVIKELPAGRVPVSTRLVPESKREDMYGFLRKEVQKGRQAYIVCPMVEDSEQGDELRSAKSVFKSLQESILKDLRIALTWGNQKSTEKDQILRDFKEGKYDILVSTTVIEVGINNPNATIMVVENAERFGLSQLHQLRGRVGRGTEQSWCFLLSEHSEKLQILCKTNDGFEISRKDLEIRGPGDLLGTRQSGEADLHSVFSGDSLLIEEVSDAVKRLHQDPGQKDILKMLEEYANSYFACTEREIALN